MKLSPCSLECIPKTGEKKLHLNVCYFHAVHPAIHILSKMIQMDSISQLKERCHQCDQAMERNDPDEIWQFMSDDWICIGSDGVTPRERFLASIRSGDLVHTRMDSDEMIVRMYGESGVVVSRGTSAGKYKGQDFSLYEWSTSVFTRSEGQWVCVLTMLTPSNSRPA